VAWRKIGIIEEIIGAENIGIMKMAAAGSGGYGGVKMAASANGEIRNNGERRWRNGESGVIESSA
jgi:hypothetical protein